MYCKNTYLYIYIYIYNTQHSIYKGNVYKQINKNVCKQKNPCIQTPIYIYLYMYNTYFLRMLHKIFVYTLLFNNNTFYFTNVLYHLDLIVDLAAGIPTS